MKKLLLFICLTFSASSFSQSIYGSEGYLPIYSPDPQERERALKTLQLRNAKSLRDSAAKVAEKGKYSEAIRLCEQALEIHSRIYGRDDRDYTIDLSNLARYYSDSGNYSEAIRLGTQTLGITAKIVGTKHEDYACDLHNLASYYADSGNYAEAVRLGTQALKLTGKLFGKKHIEYATVLSSLSAYYYSLGDFEESARLGKQALNIRQKVLGENHSDYASSLNDKAMELCMVGNYSEAVQLEEQAIKITEKELGAECQEIAILLSNLSGIRCRQGNYSEAIRNVERALEIQSKVLGTEHPDYLSPLSLLSTYQMCSGNYSEAIRIVEQALETQAKVLGTEHPDYANSILILAQCNFFLGNYYAALHWGKQAVETMSRIFGNEHLSYATSLMLLGLYQIALKNNIEAIDLLNKALEIQSKVLGTEHPDYAASLSCLSQCYWNLGNYPEAMHLGEQALEIRAKVLGTEHPDYAASLLQLSAYRMNLGNYSEAINLSLQGVKILGEENPLSAFLYGLLATCYYKSGNIQEAISCINYVTLLLNNIITSQFSNLTSNEREKFWCQYEGWYTERLNEYAYSYTTDTLCMTAYDGALLSKGLLLNSEIEMRKLLQESGDAVVDSLYEEMRINKLMLQRLYEKPKNERYLSTDSIEKIVDILEKQLLKRSKVYGDYTKNLRIDYKDVRGKLKDGDLAIEFCSFPLSKDSTMYMALVLRNDMEYPKMVPLFEEKQISKLRKDIYKGGYTATLVWKPLEQYLNKAKNVYFGPSGELYNIAIENIPHWSENCLMSDKWNIYRLSSTRELAVIRDKDVVRKASVYGGIMYDTGTDMLTDDTVRYGRQRSVFYGLYNLSDSLSVRGGVEYLPATKEEAEYVDDALKGRHIASTLRTDMQATEGAFKDMAGKRNNLLHIATHAFYWPEKEVATADKDFMFMPNMPQRYKEDKAMTRSGLILAGANNALRGMKLPEDVNDGILTAKEIAQLDLRGLDLVVLSACQTGLGEVTGDGVFGLQRGFKKAGANSLMMSLWSVDDEATSLFMKEFYRQLMAGNGKHESMKAAQRHVREYSEIDEDGEVTHPYENYKYWAAFVLLDAIH